MQLRDYQISAIESLRSSLATGHKRPVVALPTGAGKTVIAASIIRMAREKNRRVAFVVPSLTLIDQTVARFESNGIWEIGVMQAMHEMTDPNMPVQVCSIQTLARRKVPDVDIVIVDECHVQFKFLIEWMGREEWKSIPFVGLSATPWARGMGKVWDDLIIATTTEELIRIGHLSPFRCYAPAHPDLSGVKTVAGDFDLKGLSEAMQRGALVALASARRGSSDRCVRGGSAPREKYLRPFCRGGRRCRIHGCIHADGGARADREAFLWRGYSHPVQRRCSHDGLRR